MARMQAVADILLLAQQQRPPVYFIALQEVVPALDDALVPLLSSVGYHIIRQPLALGGVLPYGVALAVHESVTILEEGWQPYTGLTQMNRGFCYAHCRLPSDNDNTTTCFVTSTHLESWAGPQHTGRAARAQQLTRLEQYCASMLEGQADVAIIMGDLNWDDASRKPTDDPLEDVLMDVDWKDAWLETNHLRQTVDEKKGYTYDAKRNPMLGGNLRRRFDRCLVRTAR